MTALRQAHPPAIPFRSLLRSPIDVIINRGHWPFNNNTECYPSPEIQPIFIPGTGLSHGCTPQIEVKSCGKSELVNMGGLYLPLRSGLRGVNISS